MLYLNLIIKLSNTTNYHNISLCNCIPFLHLIIVISLHSSIVLVIVIHLNQYIHCIVIVVCIYLYIVVIDVKFTDICPYIYPTFFRQRLWIKWKSMASKLMLRNQRSSREWTLSLENRRCCFIWLHWILLMWSRNSVLLQNGVEILLRNENRRTMPSLPLQQQ